MAVTNDEDTTVQDDNPAASAAQDIKAAARDMLRMGSRWAHSALDWIDERRTDMNNRSRDERDFGDRNRYQQHSPYGASQEERERHDYERHRRYGGRSDRDIQSDFSGGGYDQVGSRDYRAGYGREGSYPQPRTMSPDDDSLRGDYGSEFGYGASSAYGTSGYGAGAGGVGYGAPGYGAGTSYGGANRYRGDFQSDRDWLRDEGESLGASQYNRGIGSQYGSQGGEQYGAYARGGRHSQESYGQFRGRQQQEWRARGTAGQGYAERGYEPGEYRTQGYGAASQSSLRGSSSGQLGRSYRGVGPRNYTRSDERIREDLNERLTDAHDIDASGISVEVNNGVATLNGTVSERWMKHRAEDIADGCSGVRDVRNMIQVSSQSPSQGSSPSQHGASQQGTQSGSSYAQGSSTTSQGGTATQGTGTSGLGTSSGSTQYGSSTSGSQGGSGSSQHASQGSTGSSGSSAGARGPNV